MITDYIKHSLAAANYLGVFVVCVSYSLFIFYTLDLSPVNIGHGF